jgi:hypothetical protein
MVKVIGERPVLRALGVKEGFGGASFFLNYAQRL